jgi:hypothetical protein
MKLRTFIRPAVVEDRFTRLVWWWCAAASVLNIAVMVWDVAVGNWTGLLIGFTLLALMAFTLWITAVEVELIQASYNDLIRVRRALAFLAAAGDIPTGKEDHGDN